ncbi:MAG: EamA/RhaT family transporter, partial [Planctomycetota bacterium]
MKARIFILLAALLFSSGGAAIKSISVGAWPVAGFRSLIAAVAVWLLMPAARRGYTWRTWLVGVAYASTMIAFVVANKLTTAAATIFLPSTAPLFSLLRGPRLRREEVGAGDRR